MGVPPKFLLNLKGMVLENKGNSSSTIPSSSSSSSSSNNNNPPSNNDNYGSLLCTTQRAKIRRKQKHMRKNNKRVVMKRTRRSNFRRRDEENGIERKVQTLRRLIPNPNPEETQGLDGLFRDTASYIVSLQMRVRVMQLMVNILENSQNYE